MTDLAPPTDRPPTRRPDPEKDAVVAGLARLLADYSVVELHHPCSETRAGATERADVVRQALAYVGTSG